MVNEETLTDYRSQEGERIRVAYAQGKQRAMRAKNDTGCYQEVSELRVYENGELYERLSCNEEDFTELSNQLEILARSGSEADEVLSEISEHLTSHESRVPHGEGWGFQY